MTSLRRRCGTRTVANIARLGRVAVLAVPAALTWGPLTWATLAVAQEAGGPDAPGNPPSVALPPVIGPAELPRDLSPWGMFLSADPLVKAVLIGLLFASVVTWTVWLAKTIELMLARRRVRAALRALASARSLAEATQRVARGKARRRLGRGRRHGASAER